MIAVHHKLYVVKTNHNSILRIDPESGKITRIRDLSVQDPAPISMVRKGKSQVRRVALSARRMPLTTRARH
jgi:hypothetical protein